MNKHDLIATVAKDAEITQALAARVLDSLALTVTNAVADGEEVAIPGLCKIKTEKRAARAGRNPITGAQIQHPAKVVPRFKASSVLKKALNPALAKRETAF